MIVMMNQLSCSQTCVLELLVGAWAVLATIREDVMVVSDRWDQAPSTAPPHGRLGILTPVPQNSTRTPNPETRNPKP